MDAVARLEVGEVDLRTAGKVAESPWCEPTGGAGSLLFVVVVGDFDRDLREVFCLMGGLTDGGVAELLEPETGAGDGWL